MAGETPSTQAQRQHPAFMISATCSDATGASLWKTIARMGYSACNVNPGALASGTERNYFESAAKASRNATSKDSAVPFFMRAATAFSAACR